MNWRRLLADALIVHQNISLSSLTVGKHHYVTVERVWLQEHVVPNHDRESQKIVQILLDR